MTEFQRAMWFIVLTCLMTLANLSRKPLIALAVFIVAAGCHLALGLSL